MTIQSADSHVQRRGVYVLQGSPLHVLDTAFQGSQHILVLLGSAVHAGSMYLPQSPSVTVSLDNLRSRCSYQGLAWS